MCPHCIYIYICKDEWQSKSAIRYQEELPLLISSRPDKHIIHSELVKLMEWKLTVRIPKSLQILCHCSSQCPDCYRQAACSYVTNPCAGLQRGKFRPRLQQLVASNSEATVEKCSRKAFGHLPHVKAAIAELSSLKGVGPATASGELRVDIEASGWKFNSSWELLLFSSIVSIHFMAAFKPFSWGWLSIFVPAVLAAGAPDEAAFMSDEAMERVPGLKPIQYTAKHYSLYLDKMVEKAKSLNRGNLGSTEGSICIDWFCECLQIMKTSP